jgi:hypothetical protein
VKLGMTNSVPYLHPSLIKRLLYSLTWKNSNV